MIGTVVGEFSHEILAAQLARRCISKLGFKLQCTLEYDYGDLAGSIVAAFHCNWKKSGVYEMSVGEKMYFEISV